MNKYWEDKIKGPTVVDVSASWCGHCREIAPVLNELEEWYGKQIGFVRIDADSCPQEILDELKVDELPGLYVWRDAELQKTDLKGIKDYCISSWKTRGKDYYTRADVEKMVKDAGKDIKDFDRFMWGQGAPYYDFESNPYCYFVGDVERFLRSNPRSEERFLR